MNERVVKVDQAELRDALDRVGPAARQALAAAGDRDRLGERQFSDDRVSELAQWVYESPERLGAVLGVLLDGLAVADRGASDVFDAAPGRFLDAVLAELRSSYEPAR